jgi:dihydroorotate dehydrogenase (fumarate)
MVLFNRFYTPDIDIDKLALSAASVITSPEEIYETLRWIAIMSDRVDCDLAASTGIHTGDDVVKMLLAGAKVTQVASTLYKNGPEQITRMLERLEGWMKEKGFDSVDQFRGKVAAAYAGNPAVFERMQFMKYFSEIR